MSLNFIYKTKYFGILLNCGNSKMVGPRTINLGIHVHINKGIFVVKFQQDLGLHVKITNDLELCAKSKHLEFILLYTTRPLELLYARYFDLPALQVILHTKKRLNGDLEDDKKVCLSLCIRFTFFYRHWSRWKHQSVDFLTVFLSLEWLQSFSYQQLDELAMTFLLFFSDL